MTAPWLKNLRGGYGPCVRADGKCALAGGSSWKTEWIEAKPFAVNKLLFTANFAIETKCNLLKNSACLHKVLAVLLLSTSNTSR